MSTDSNAAASPALLRRASQATVLVLAVALAGEIAVGGRSEIDALSDVPGRLIAHHIHAGALPYIGWKTEYPVVVGLAQWVASWFGGSPLGFLLATAAISSVLALVLMRMLARASGPSVWHAILAPAFVLYVFHNWDLLAIVPAVAGVLAFDDGRDGASGAFIAIGACAKVFPAVFLPPLIARRVYENGWRAAVPLVAGAVVTTVVLNLPFALGSVRRWSFPYHFQSKRGVTWGTVWSVPGRVPGIGRHLEILSGGVANALSVTVLIVAIGALCVLATKRRLSAVAIGAAATGIFLIANKVYSPNYDLWLVPWLALIPLARHWRVALGCFTTGVFIVVFGFFHENFGHEIPSGAMPFLVLGRAVAIAALVAAAIGLRDSGRRRPAIDAPVRAQMPTVPREP